MTEEDRTMKAMPLLLVAIFSATTLRAQTLTDEQIASAIQAGEARRFNHLMSDCTARPGLGESVGANLRGGVNRAGTYTVTVSTNLGRIAHMAARATRLYKPFSPSDVTEDLRAPAVVVSVEPNEASRTSGSISVPAPVEHVVLKSRIYEVFSIQPRNVETEPVEYNNLFGAKFEASRAVAFFEYSAVLELPAGDLIVVVITPAGERRCTIGTKDRARLFPAAR